MENFMTREEQRQIKEKRKALELAIKNKSKFYGYKTVNGYMYKIINDFAFILFINSDINILVSIRCKPLMLDKIFWKVFGNMEEIAEKQPLSFHITGAFTARAINIEDLDLEYSSTAEAEAKLKNIIDCSNEIIDKYMKNVNSIDAFYESIVEDKSQYLNIILLEILKKDYKKALERIEECMKNQQNGGFIDVNRKSIIEDAKEYCEKFMQLAPDKMKTSTSLLGVKN